MVPKLIHFIFGIDKTFCGKPFSFFHYLAVKSFKDVHPDYEVRFHVCYEPVGKWWEETKKLVVLVKIPPEDIPEEIFGIKIYYPEHKGDIVRLRVLNEYGGIYTDIDSICVKRFDPLLSYPFVLGQEIFEGELNGLCNALMIAEPKSEFGSYWYNSYKEFNPHDWNQISVRKSLELERMYPNIIRVEPSCSFFKFMWDAAGQSMLFESISPVDDCYSIHMWETKMYDYLAKITPESVFEVDSTYNLLARRHIVNQR